MVRFLMIRVAMVVFSYYPADPRPRREAEALIQHNISVDVICLRGETELPIENNNGVTTYRLPLQRKRAGKLHYIFEYAYFIFIAFIKLTLLHIRKKYTIVHVHNMPDILVFSALVPKLTGAKVILDLHDPMPEVFMTKYYLDASHPITRFMCFLEKCSIRFSDIALTPNIAFRKLFLSRSCSANKIQIVMNSPDEKIFSRNQKGNKTSVNNDTFTIMYHGTVTERHGLNCSVVPLQ